MVGQKSERCGVPEGCEEEPSQQADTTTSGLLSSKTEKTPPLFMPQSLGFSVVYN